MTRLASFGIPIAAEFHYIYAHSANAVIRLVPDSMHTVNIIMHILDSFPTCIPQEPNSTDIHGGGLEVPDIFLQNALGWVPVRPFPSPFQGLPWSKLIPFSWSTLVRLRTGRTRSFEHYEPQSGQVRANRTKCPSIVEFGLRPWLVAFFHVLFTEYLFQGMCEKIVVPLTLAV